MVAPKPISLRLRMYNVGFGDCFLLSLFYGQPVGDAENADEKRDARHILFDCGSTSRSRGRQTLLSVVRSIERDCDKRLDAVVISHRHRDHLSGFGAKESGEILARLKPRLVVRSWTEHPDLDAKATGPGAGDPGMALAGTDARPSRGSARGGGRAAADELPHDDESKAYIASLRRAENLAALVVERSNEMGLGEQSDLVSVARNQMPNDEAVTLLKELSDGGRGEYLSSERRQTRLNDIVPGVKFTVIGPPTPKQWPRVARQADASDEFWVGAEKEAGRLFAEPAPDARRPPLGTARWIVDKLRDGEQEQVTGLARWLDDAMNNTSVVLLLEAGKHRLLFGGDAQVEAWGWVLNQTEDPGLRTKLRDVDLYKVGHHGSRNASPRKLVKLWQDRPRAPFLSMLSTKRGVHGSGEHVVPRPTLVKALKALGPVLSTDETEADWLQVTADLPDGSYKVAAAPTDSEPRRRESRRQPPGRQPRTRASSPATPRTR